MSCFRRYLKDGTNSIYLSSPPNQAKLSANQGRLQFGTRPVNGKKFSQNQYGFQTLLIIVQKRLGNVFSSFLFQWWAIYIMFNDSLRARFLLHQLHNVLITGLFKIQWYPWRGYTKFSSFPEFWISNLSFYASEKLQTRDDSTGEPPLMMSRLT